LSRSAAASVAASLAGSSAVDRAGLTDTLIGDLSRRSDRRLLGLTGTMSEAELRVLRARLSGGIPNKAARRAAAWTAGGFVWGEADGEVLFHEAVGMMLLVTTMEL
jgi:hypothetical protein